MIHTKSFDASAQEIGEMCEALFEGKHHGFVAVSASDRGRRAVEAVFPGAHIEWRFHADNALGWGEFSLNVIDCTVLPGHRLPLEITHGASLHDATPDALAYLLAMGVRRQGVCVALIDADGHASIFKSAREH
jgi:hypothetical protein